VTSYADFGFESDDLVLQAGDKVKVHCTFGFSSDQPGNSYTRIAVYDGTTTAGLGGTEVYMDVPSSEGGFLMPVSLVGLHEIETSGTYRYKLQGHCPGGSTIRVNGTRQVIVEILRP
jgi:hypothetical protein